MQPGNQGIPGHGSEFGYDRPAVERGSHIDNQEIPVLEAPVQHRFPIVGKIVFVEGPEPFEIPAEKKYRFFGQLRASSSYP